MLAAGQVERILQYYGEDRCTHTSLHMVLHCPATPVQHRAAGTSGNEHRCFRPRRHLQPARRHRQRDPAICSPCRAYRTRLLNRAVVGVVLSLKTTIPPAVHSRKASTTQTGLVLARMHQAETCVSLLQPLSARHSSWHIVLCRTSHLYGGGDVVDSCRLSAACSPGPPGTLECGSVIPSSLGSRPPLANAPPFCVAVRSSRSHVRHLKA